MIRISSRLNDNYDSAIRYFGKGNFKNGLIEVVRRNLLITRFPLKIKGIFRSNDGKPVSLSIEEHVYDAIITYGRGSLCKGLSYLGYWAEKEEFRLDEEEARKPRVYKYVCFMPMDPIDI